MFFRKRDRQNRLRPLSERECYLRLHGARSGEIEVVASRRPRSRELEALFGTEPPAPLQPQEAVARRREPPPFAPVKGESGTGSPVPTGPTELTPAPHLVFDYPRGAGTVTGEQLRRGLLRRMESRQGEAA